MRALEAACSDMLLQAHSEHEPLLNLQLNFRSCYMCLARTGTVHCDPLPVYCHS